MRVLIKGAGDLATGVAHRLKQCGFQILMTEIEKPTAVRRTVAFSSAIYEQQIIIEGIKAVYCSTQEEVNRCIGQGDIPIIIDPNAESLSWFRAEVVIDAIVAKKNIGTSIHDGAIVIGLGPGFTATVDCDCVVETMRGHYLGKCIYEGGAYPNTGVPGEIGGYTTERLLRASADGIWKTDKSIGDYVQYGDIVAEVDGIPVIAQATGIIRGLLPNQIPVFKGMKAGDIDPRCELEHCFTISDKARSIGGGVLEGILYLARRKKDER